VKSVLDVNRTDAETGEITSYIFEDGKEAYISFSRAGSSKCTLLCYASQDMQQVDQKAYSTVPRHPLPCSEEKDRVKISEPCGNTQNPCVLMSDPDTKFVPPGIIRKSTIFRLYSVAISHYQPMCPPVSFFGNLIPFIIHNNPTESNS
jgi:hypothetical protein